MRGASSILLTIALGINLARAAEAEAECCSVIANKEACPDPYVYETPYPNGSATFNGVNATKCCLTEKVVFAGVSGGDTWCEGSAGKSEEVDPNANADVVIESSSSSSVEVTSKVDQTTESHSEQSQSSSTSSSSNASNRFSSSSSSSFVVSMLVSAIIGVLVAL